MGVLPPKLNSFAYYSTRVIICPVIDCDSEENGYEVQFVKDLVKIELIENMLVLHFSSFGIYMWQVDSEEADTVIKQLVQLRVLNGDNFERFKSQGILELRKISEQAINV